uniref:Phostensin/Taperin PP1-binding domain-containing protein n=1 Tax=Meleagris gallopavo TaxID=9103 RepID=A0A803YHP4_MELGA
MEISSVPLYRPHSPGLHQRGGNTFTVVPKRKPGASGPQGLTEAGGRPQREEEEEDEESKGRSKTVENADGPQVGTSHKKRYPTVNEIEVIGGYLSLERSCMSKTGSRRKKVMAWGTALSREAQRSSSLPLAWLLAYPVLVSRSAVGAAGQGGGQLGVGCVPR